MELSPTGMAWESRAFESSWLLPRVHMRGKLELRAEPGLEPPIWAVGVPDSTVTGIPNACLDIGGFQEQSQ